MTQTRHRAALHRGLLLCELAASLQLVLTVVIGQQSHGYCV